MKRSRNGKMIHRDGCRRAVRAVHWMWADQFITEREVILNMRAFPWLKLCRICFADVGKDTPP